MLQPLQGLGRMGGVDDAGKGQLAIDAVAPGDIGDHPRPVLAGIDDALTERLAVDRDDFLGFVLGRSRQMAGVAAGRTPADRLALDQHDTRAGLGRVQSGRATGDAAAHDGDVGIDVLAERCEIERLAAAHPVRRAGKIGAVPARRIHRPSLLSPGPHRKPGCARRRSAGCPCRSHRIAGYSRRGRRRRHARWKRAARPAGRD